MGSVWWNFWTSPSLHPFPQPDPATPAAIPPARRRARPHGFTLLEVLVVLAVVVTLLCLAMAGYTRLIASTAINSGAQLVDDVMTEARQDAVTQNSTVEVRLYAAPDGTGFTALQLHGRQTDGTTPGLAPTVVLPEAVVIDATPAHLVLATTQADAPAADPQDPRFNSATRCFHFLPDGSTDLAATGMITIRAAAQSDPAHFPANWACVEIDPLSGRAQVYRP